MATSKDRVRVETLIRYATDHGLVEGIAKAERDADKIEHLAKCEERARLLRSNNWNALAVPFENRAKYLRASGVTA